MLVLSRKIGERIHIGENITIEIRRVAGNRVTLALEAPRTVRILRGELEQAAREFREPTNDREWRPGGAGTLRSDSSPSVVPRIDAAEIAPHARLSSSTSQSQRSCRSRV